MPGFELSRVDLRNTTVSVSLADGSERRQTVRCETQLDYAEPRELLRRYLELPSELK
jgi:hypothetical protein